MTTTTRRNIIAGAAAMPLLPATALAAPGNATDAAWSAYEAAKANYEANDQAYDAFEATIPIGPRPRFDDFEDRDEWESLADQWEQERAGYPDNPFRLDDDALDALCAPMSATEGAILATPATTLTDIERKLTVVSGWNGENDIPAELVDGILSDLRSLMGVAS
jgi:hypothetical protein